MRTNGLANVIRTSLVLLLSFQLCSIVRAQGAGGNSTQKIIRKNGWQIPGRDDMGTLARMDEVNIEGIKVNQRILRSYSEAEPLAIVDFFSKDSDGNITVSSRLFTVRTLIEYEVNGKIFAYQVALIPTDAHRNGTRTTIGVTYTFFYVDEDGDGNFESRYDNGKLPGVPNWAKTADAKSGSR